MAGMAGAGGATLRGRRVPRGAVRPRDSLPHAGMASTEVTTLLGRVRSGDDAALDGLFSVVYDELHRMARRQLRKESEGHTLSATALVHEAYIKLVGNEGTGAEWSDRRHFFAIAARAMRQILVDHARARLAQKRGGGGIAVTLGDALSSGERDEESLIALNDALDRLAALSPRLAKIVEFRFFAGLTDAESADVLGVSERTLNRDWRKARAFLSRELADA